MPVLAARSSAKRPSRSALEAVERAQVGEISPPISCRLCAPSRCKDTGRTQASVPQSPRRSLRCFRRQPGRSASANLSMRRDPLMSVAGGKAAMGGELQGRPSSPTCARASLSKSKSATCPGQSCTVMSEQPSPPATRPGISHCCLRTTPPRRFSYPGGAAHPGAKSRSTTSNPRIELRPGMSVNPDY